MGETPAGGGDAPVPVPVPVSVSVSVSVPAPPPPAKGRRPPPGSCALSRGRCLLCGADLTKAQMIRHIASCAARRVRPPLATGPAPTDTPDREGFHLYVQGRQLPHYWLHVEARADLTLAAVDQFLREVWLECCGHPSTFTIDGRLYAAPGEGGSVADARPLDAPLGTVLRPALAIRYDYDPGDPGASTPLMLRVVDRHPWIAGPASLRLVARNHPPPEACGGCGRPATSVCPRCVTDPAGWCCDACAPRHPCGPGILLPAANSPRVGTCLYRGLPPAAGTGPRRSA